MPSLNMPVQRLKVTVLPLDLPFSGPVTHSREILTTASLTERNRTDSLKTTTWKWIIHIELNMYNPTNSDISLTVYNVHLYYDHTLYSLEYAPIL